MLCELRGPSNSIYVALNIRRKLFKTLTACTDRSVVDPVARCWALWGRLSQTEEAAKDIIRDTARQTNAPPDQLVGELNMELSNSHQSVALTYTEQ